MQGSLRERAPGVWEVRVRSGRDPLTGRCQQVSRTVHGEKRAAEAQLARLATEIDNGAHRGTSESVGYLLDRWAEHLEMLGRSPKTIDGYRSIIRARLRPALGSVALRRLQPADLDRFYRALSQTGSPPLGPPLPRGALGGACRQAVKWGWIDRSPAERATPPPVPRTEVDPRAPRRCRSCSGSSSAPVTTWRAWSSSPRRRGAAAESCARSAGATSTSTTRFSSSRARSPRSAGSSTRRTRRRTGRAGSPSTLDGRDPPVPRRGDARAGRALRRRDGARRVRVVGAPSCTEPWRPGRVTDAFLSTRQRIGLDRVDFHHLRHFAATTLAGAGVDVRTIAGRLGHADPAITLWTYAHFLEAADRQAAAVMGRLELGAPPSP